MQECSHPNLRPVILYPGHQVGWLTYTADGWLTYTADGTPVVRPTSEEAIQCAQNPPPPYPETSSRQKSTRS